MLPVYGIIPGKTSNRVVQFGLISMQKSCDQVKQNFEMINKIAISLGIVSKLQIKCRIQTEYSNI